MTKTTALMELTRLRDNSRESGLALLLDVDEMIVFHREEAEHRDYVFWRGVADGDDYTVEQCVDRDGNCSLTRVWRTPQERAARAADRSLSQG